MSDDRQRVGLTKGTLIDGRYRIESELGRGGYARVYRAAHTDLERGVALKVIELPERPGAVDIFIERFLREARIAANLSHPNVVTVYDYGVVEQTGQPYLAMELLDGWDLAMVLSHHGPMEPARAIKLMIDALDALAEAQSKGIVHKDLKPSNLFLVGEGSARERLVLIDFGIARIWDDDDSRITQTGGFTGTPAYFAPEYVEHQIVTPAIDVYQCALILVEMMTSVPAVIAENSMQYLLKHCAGEVDIPAELRDSVLGPVLDNALSIDHEERYPDCAAFRDALAAIDASEVPQPARGGGPVVRHNTLETTPHTDEFADSIASGDTLAAPLRPVPANPGTPPSAIPGQAAAPAPPPRSVLPWIVVALVVLAGVAAAWLHKDPAPVARANQPSVVTPAAPEVPRQAPVAEAARVTAPPPPEAAYILSTPTGALITIDDTKYGPTPVRLGGTLLDGEKHRLLLTKKGFKPLRTEVVLAPGKRIKLDLDRARKAEQPNRKNRKKTRTPEILAP